MTNYPTKNSVPAGERHIVAIGGSSNSAPGRTGRMLEYLLSLNSDKQNQRILVIDTATGDDKGERLALLEIWQIVARSIPCSLSFLKLFARTPTDLRSLLLSQDIIYVGGGNTKSMLAVWQAYGIDHLIHEAWKNGVVLAGSSAGGICWFESCLTDSFEGSYTNLPCLGILKGSCCPHYDGEPTRKETYHAMIAAGKLPGGYAIDEATAIHFVGTEVHEVITVSPRPNAGAYRVTATGGNCQGCCGDCGDDCQCAYNAIPLVGRRGCGGDCASGDIQEETLPASKLA